MRSHKENTLLVDSVHLEFGRNTVLQSAYITSRTGRVTGVLGRNGAGKSSLFKCIMGGIRPQNMFIRFNDEPSVDYGHIGRRVKYLPQRNFYIRLGQPSTELSGGEAWIAGMYLVLMSDAEFCILVEPFSNVAPNCSEKIQALILEQKSRKGIIVSDHMYEQIIGISDDLYLLRDGYTFPIKSREDLIDNGYIRR